MHRIARMAKAATVVAVSVGSLLVTTPASAAIVSFPSCARAFMPATVGQFYEGTNRITVSVFHEMVKSPCNDINIYNIASTANGDRLATVRVRYLMTPSNSTVATPWVMLYGFGVVYRNGAGGWHEAKGWPFRFEFNMGRYGPGSFNCIGMF